LFESVKYRLSLLIFIGNITDPGLVLLVPEYAVVLKEKASEMIVRNINLALIVCFFVVLSLKFCLLPPFNGDVEHFDPRDFLTHKAGRLVTILCYGYLMHEYQ
jgi:hypothetical protein